MANLREQAQERVHNTPELKIHEDTIMYDWPEEDHWQWVVSAPIHEIVDWAETVEQQ